MLQDRRGVTRLRLALLDDGRRQNIIAEAAGMPGSRVSEYALGKKEIPAHHLIALSTVLRRDPQDLVGYAEEIEI